MKLIDLDWNGSLLCLRILDFLQSRRQWDTAGVCPHPLPSNPTNTLNDPLYCESIFMPYS